MLFLNRNKLHESFIAKFNSSSFIFSSKFIYNLCQRHFPRSFLKNFLMGSRTLISKLMGLRSLITKCMGLAELIEPMVTQGRC